MSNPPPPQQKQQYRPPSNGGSIRDGRMAPARGQQQPRAFPNEVHHQRRAAAASSRSQPMSQPKPQFRQQQQQQQPRQQHQLQATHNGADNAPNSNGGGGDTFARKLQASVNLVREERENEGRARKKANDRLKGAKESFMVMQRQVQEGQKKNKTMTEEIKKLELQIKEKTESNAVIKMKYEFTHQDLLRKREKIQEFQKGAKDEGEKQKKTASESRILAEKQKNLIDTREAKETKPGLFQALLGKRQRDLNDKKAGSTKTLARLRKKEDKRLARDLEALHAQACLPMLPDMIKSKVQTIEKQTETARADIARLKAAMPSNASRSVGGRFGPVVLKPSGTTNHAICGQRHIDGSIEES